MKIVQIKDVTDDDIKKYTKRPFVIPTETVYGLAARIDDDNALRSIFSIKNRPCDNPLIVHISGIHMLKDLIDEEIPHDYSALIQKFWPGPLTLLFKCKDTVSRLVVGNNAGIVAVRMPKGEPLRDLIGRIGIPLAAPSANTSGKPSPTTVNHTVDDLGNKVELYIDDGPCEIGLESTVLGIINGDPVILRPGKVTKEEIEGVLKKSVVIKNKVTGNEVPVCPGQKYKHYSPDHPIYLFKGSNWSENMEKEYQKLAGVKIGILKRGSFQYPVNFSEEYFLGDDLSECSTRIFSGLRELDKRCDIMFILGFELKDIGLAIMDRLEKAATYIIE